MNSSVLELKEEIILIMECPPFQGQAFCSDSDCSCSNTIMPPGKGYLWIKPEIVETRKKCLTLAEMQKHMATTKTTTIDEIRERYLPIVVCEKAAIKRNLNLDVASADFTMWVMRGKVLCRPTPIIVASDSLNSIGHSFEGDSKSNAEDVCPNCGDFVSDITKCNTCDVNSTNIEDMSIDVQTTNNIIDDSLEQMKKNNNWFISVENNNSEKEFFTKPQINVEFRNKIIAGLFNGKSSVQIFNKKEDGTWDSSNHVIEDFSKNYYKLGVLFKPFMTNATAGLKYGTLVGIVLKLIDSFIFLVMIDPRMALMFLISIGVCFIPRIGTIAMIFIGFLTAKLFPINFFFVGIIAALTGAILGCLPGLFVGSIVGLIRKNSTPKAIDASPESKLQTYMIPLLSAVGGTGIILFYIEIFLPWLESI